jgi:6-phosphogluconate dehydrogenase
MNSPAAVPTSASPRVTLGMVGLGRMGANLVRRAMADGHSTVVYDPQAAAVEALAAEGSVGTSSLADLVAALPAPRAVWVMVPAGHITESVVTELIGLLEPGDCLIDGGNSYYRDDMRRGELAAAKGIDYLDCRDLRRRLGQGPRLLPHDRRRRRGQSTGSPPCGTPSRPVSTRHRAPPAYRRSGSRGARLAALRPVRSRSLRQDGPQRHRVRAHGRLRRGAEHPEARQRRQGRPRRRRRDRPWSDPQFYQYDLDLPAIAEVWRRGSVVGSWLLDLTAAAMHQSPELDEFSGRVSDSGEGRWTSIAAIEEGVPRRSSPPRCTSASTHRAAASSRARFSARCARSSAGTTRRSSRPRTGAGAT